MSFVTLGEALEGALASMIENGVEPVGAGSDALKNAEAEAPASWCQGDTALPVQEVHTDKGRRIAPAAPKADMGRPSPAVRRSLFAVIEGGGDPAEGQGVIWPGRLARAAGGGRTAASKLVLAWDGDHAALR